MKDEQIRFLLDSKTKSKFKKVCDGRPMTLVIIKLIEEYIAKNEDNEEDELL